MKQYDEIGGNSQFLPSPRGLKHLDPISSTPISKTSIQGKSAKKNLALSAAVAHKQFLPTIPPILSVECRGKR